MQYQQDRHSIADLLTISEWSNYLWSSKKHKSLLCRLSKPNMLLRLTPRKSTVAAHVRQRNPKRAAQAITISSDNQGAIALSKDNKFHARTKHIDVRYHFIREAVEWKVCQCILPTDENPQISSQSFAKAKFEGLWSYWVCGRSTKENGRKKEDAK